LLGVIAEPVRELYRPGGAEDFLEWPGALERADAVRARLLGDGWIDVS
jgi:hypothetical protein